MNIELAVWLVVKFLSEGIFMEITQTIEKAVVQSFKKNHEDISNMVKLLENAGYYVSSIEASLTGISLNCYHQGSNFEKDK